MRIEEIRLINYRQYKDQKLIFHSEDEEKHLIVIQGAMGTGKTNILNAIYWCLYGEELDITDKNKGKPIINDVTRHSARVGDKLSVTVELLMRDEENKKVIFSREKNFERGNSPNLCKPIYDGTNSKDGTKFSILQEKEKFQLEPVRGDLDEVIIKSFPNEISRYFLFNGEYLDKYFREPKNIKQEVQNLSQLTILNTLTTHLSARIKEMNEQLKKANPEADRFLELKQNCELKLKEIEDDLVRLNNEKIKLKGIEETLRSNLKNSSSDMIKSLEDERERLNGQKEFLEERMKSNEQLRNKYIIDMMPYIMAFDSIYNTLSKIKEKRDKGEFPPLIDQDLLKGILKNNRCICGTDLSKKADAQEKIKELLRTYTFNRNLTVEVSDMELRLKEIYREVKDFLGKQSMYSSDIKRCQDDMHKIESRLDRISTEIKGSDVEQVSQWETQLKETVGRLEGILSRIGEIRAKMEGIKRDRDKYAEDYKKELNKMQTQEKLRNKLKFCLEAQQVIEVLKDQIMEEIRNCIQSATEEQFFKLHWKKESYSKVSIDEDYNISVKDKLGYECIGTLSAGERQILALSFMAALNTVSGFNFPIIIDTPLGRISREPKANIARNLPNYLKGRQVILLVTEEEYSKEVRELIKANVCQEYFIKFKEKDLGAEAEIIKLE